MIEIHEEIHNICIKLKKEFIEHNYGDGKYELKIEIYVRDNGNDFSLLKTSMFKTETLNSNK